MKKLMMNILVGGWMAATMAGCAAPTASAVAPTASQPALKTVSAATSRRVLALDGGTQAKLWGFYFVSATHEYKTVKRSEDYQIWTRNSRGKRVQTWRTREWTETIDLGWKLNYSFAGDGEVRHLGGSRFSYVVPDDKVLVLNSVEIPNFVNINGFPLGSSYAKRAEDRYTVNYVFGPGETVVFNFNLGGSISGYLADPALLGGMGSVGGPK